MSAIKESIERDGQSYIDEPIYAQPKDRTLVSLLVEAAFNRGEVRLQRPVLLHHERVRLHWLKPDGKGGLIQK